MTNYNLRLVLVGTVCLIGGGCGLIPKSVDLPRESGPWVGRIVQISVYADKEGTEHPAAALVIESGPLMHPANEKPREIGPILAQRTSHLERLLDPATLPIGVRVRVEGTMFREGNVFLPGEVRTFSRCRHIGKMESDSEWIILITRPPQPLDE